MADEVHGITIKLIGDASDAKKKLTDLGKTKVKPVEVTVAINDEAVKKRLSEIAAENRLALSKAGIDAKNGEKFKIEFAPDDTKVKRALREVTASKHTVIVGMRAKWDVAQELYKELQKPVPVQVVEKREEPKRVEHPDEKVNVVEKRVPARPIPQAAPQDRQALERSRRIVAEMNAVGNAASASGKKSKNAFFSITGSINKAFYALRAFQRLLTGMTIVATVMIVVNALKKAYKAIEEIRNAVARARFAAEMELAASATGRLVGQHERLLRLMEKENDALAKQRELRELEQSIADDEEDGRRAADRARRIYEASTPEEEQALRDRFAAEDERIAAARKKRDTENRISDLEKEDSIISSKAGGYRYNNEDIDKQIGRLEWDRKFTRSMKEGDLEKIDKQIEELKKRKEANEAEIARLDKEAQHRRDLIAVLEKSLGVGGGATAGDWERKAEAKRREQAAFEEEKRKARESDDAARKFAESARMETAAEAAAKRSRWSSALESSYSAGQVSQNRLTALGLGSGVGGSDGVATEMRKVISLLEAQLAATRENKPAGPQATTYSE